MKARKTYSIITKQVYKDIHNIELQKYVDDKATKNYRAVELQAYYVEKPELTKYIH